MALLVAVGGAALGSSIGIGSAMGWAIGSAVGSMLFPPEGANTVTEGPRLGDLSVSGASYGAARQLGFGTMRQAGNIIWTSGIEEHKNTRKVSSGKGMGGSSQTTITYSYSATFAIAFGEGLADDVLRIWADGKLIFDKRGTETHTRKRGLNFRFYKGSETQLPDSAIQAAEGEDATPAFRGTSYILFDGLPLEDFGNRVPSITAEITYALTDARLAIKSDRFDGGVTSYDANAFGIDWDREVAYTYSTVDDVLRRVNLTTMLEDRQVAGASTFQQLGGETTSWSYRMAVMPDGGIIAIPNETGSGSTEPVVRIDPDSLVETNRFGGSGGASFTMGPNDFTQVERIAAMSMFGLKGAISYVLCSSVLDDIGVLSYPELEYVWDSKTFDVGIADEVKSLLSGRIGEAEGTAYFTTASGSALFSTPLSIYKITIGPTAPRNSPDAVDVEKLLEITVADLAPGETNLSDAGVGLVYDESDDTIMFFVKRGSGSWFMVKFDPETKQIIWRTEDFLVDAPTRLNSISFSRVQDNTFGFMNGTGNGVLVNTQTGVLLHDDTAPDWGQNMETGANGVYDSATETWVSMTASAESSLVGRWFFNRGAGNPAPLSEIVQSLCEKADMLPADVDVTDLATTLVPGYAVGRQSTARAAIETLSQIYLFDGVESDFILKFVLRGKDPVRTIVQDEMALLDNKTGEFIKENRMQEVELPERYTVTYMDKDNNYAQNAHSAKRILLPTPSMYSHNQMGVSAAIALSAETAKQQAEKSLYSAWVERSNFELKLAWTHLDLDPTDVINISLNNGIQFRTRIAQFDVGEGFTLDLNSLSEEVLQFTSDVLADSGSGVAAQAVSTTSVVKTLLIDSPLLRDADEPSSRSYSPLYFFMGGYHDDQFGRASLYKSSDEVLYEPAGDILSGMTWGATQNALADPPFNNPFATDTENSITLFMNTGAVDLESVTQLQMLNGANGAALLKTNGEIEVIQFKDVTENPNGTFTLSCLLRGRRGTDSMTNNHTAGETFVLLFPADGELVPLGLGERGVVRYYKGVGNGQLIEEANRQSVVSLHRTLKPYAPVQVAAVVNATDIDVTWQRRTRVGGALANFISAIPLSEDTEGYEIDALDAPDGAVVRTFTGITSATQKYLNADLVTDYGGIPAQLFLRVYQVSVQVGRGFTREVTVDVE